ncbi:hypothetical protein F4604DRAFT_1916221 [Suillus subluteus]|nr:hypothetical protein F4604DRAFT_1916221 [Suillus subluteus]
MSAIPDPFFMPLATSACAPHFNGDADQLLAFLETVDQLSDKAGLPDKACIKLAMRYADPIEAGAWRYIQESKGDNYEDFANAVLPLYPGYSLGRFKRSNPKNTAASDASDPIPCVCDPQECTSDPLHPQVQDISPASSVILVPTPAVASLDKIASPPVQNDLKADPLCHLTDPTSSLHRAKQVPQSSTQILFLEKSCIADDTAFFDLCSICPVDEVSSVAPEADLARTVSHDSVAHLEHPRVATSVSHLHKNMVCLDLPLLSRVLPVLCSKLSRSEIPTDTPAFMRALTVQDDVSDDPTALSWRAQTAFDIRKFRVFTINMVLTFASPFSCVSLERTKPRYYPKLMRPDSAHPLMSCARIPALHSFTTGVYFGFPSQNHIFGITLVTEHVSSSLPWLIFDPTLMRMHSRASHDHAHIPALRTYASETYLEQNPQPDAANLALFTQQDSCTLQSHDLMLMCAGSRAHHMLAHLSACRMLRIRHPLQVSSQEHQPSHSSIALYLYGCRRDRIRKKRKTRR